MTTSKKLKKEFMDYIHNDKLNELIDLLLKNPSFELEFLSNEQTQENNNNFLGIIYFCIKYQSLNCFRYFLSRMNIEQLKNSSKDIISSYHKNEDFTNEFIMICNIKSNELNDYVLMSNIIYNIIQFIIPVEKVSKLLEDKNIKNSFIYYLENDNNFKNLFELSVAQNNIQWFKFFYDFYKNNNLSFINIYILSMIYSYDIRRKIKILNILDDFDLNQKVRFFNYRSKFKPESEFEYSLYFFAIIVGIFNKKTFPKLDYFKNNIFENEFINMINDNSDAFRFDNNIFENIIRLQYSTHFFELFYINDKMDFEEKIKTLLPYLTPNICDFLENYVKKCFQNISKKTTNNDTTYQTILQKNIDSINIIRNKNNK